MTVMNLLYGIDSEPQNPQQGALPIQLRGAHRAKLRDGMITFFVGQIMEMPLEKRKPFILGSSILPDLKEIFVKRLEEVAARCEDIKMKLSACLKAEETIELLQEIMCLNVQKSIDLGPDSQREQNSRPVDVTQYLGIMQDNTRDNRLFEMLKDWFDCTISTRQGFDDYIQNRDSVVRVKIYLKLCEDITARFSESIRDNKVLRSISIMHDKILAEEAVTLFAALKMNTSLTYLSVTVCPIGDQGATALADVLSVHPSLASLRFWSNYVGPKGAQAIANVLQTNTVLRELRLRYNSIQDLGAQSFREALKMNVTLTVLDFSCIGLTDSGAIALAEGLCENRTLTELVLSHNRIQDLGAVQLAEALKKNRSLTSLNLWSNKIADKGADTFIEVLTINDVLTCLILNYNSFGEEVRSQLKDMKDQFPSKQIDF